MKNIIATVALVAATGAAAQDSIDLLVLDIQNNQTESQMQLLNQLIQDESATREYKFVSVEDAFRSKSKSFSLFGMNLGNGAARDIVEGAGMHVSNTVEGIAAISGEVIGIGRDIVGGGLLSIGNFISR